jgi:hypothetical protein
VEFRLIYDGKLPAASRSDTRNVDKDRIRRVLSKQLAELFYTHPALKGWLEKDQTLDGMDDDVRANYETKLKRGESYSVVDLLSYKYERCGKRFVPLISSPYGIACSLHILFFRRDQPGNLIVSGGDLDNRIKVLLDALRLPQNCDEVLAPRLGDEDQSPVFVLLQDDSLIVDLQVTSDRLLTPRVDGEHIHDVKLIIHAKTVIVDSTQWGALTFG